MIAQGTELVGNHPKFVKAVEFAKNISVTKAPVLIVGETGTGKRSFCHYIHQNSSRAQNEILFVDCSQDFRIVENEILGYRDEATGRFNKGALERSNGSTVVLQNIDALEENFQKRVYKIFLELQDYDLDVRILATTTKNLSKYVGAGRFYRALYTFFSGSQITLNPIRERGDDIAYLAKYFLNKETNGESDFTPEALDKVVTFYWTHNVAELRSVIENAIPNTKDGMIDVAALELGEKKVDLISNNGDEDGIKLMSLKDAEKLLIKKALIHTSENRTQAAKILGVSIRTLRNKINEYRGNGNQYFLNLR